jgi:heptosyltransferase-2
MTDSTSAHAEIVVIKLGALGDIVRTSYLMAAYAKARDAKLTWITRRNGVDLLRFNPHVHRILTLEDDPMPTRADTLLSLDDEIEAVSIAKGIDAQRRIGAFITEDGAIRYTDSASPWFDMGLISRFGKERADELKKLNARSHVEIFSEVLSLDDVHPFFHGDPAEEARWRARRGGAAKVIGFNLFAGHRWPAKELPGPESVAVLQAMDRCMADQGAPYKLVAFSDESNLARFDDLKARAPFVELWDTGRSTLAFAAAVAACDYVVSTDSLGLHLAIAQQVPNLSFYAPTSAVEIDTFGHGVKVVSTSPDYCTYRRDADNRTLTAERILGTWQAHAREIGLIRHD